MSTAAMMSRDSRIHIRIWHECIGREWLSFEWRIVAFHGSKEEGRIWPAKLGKGSQHVRVLQKGIDFVKL